MKLELSGYHKSENWVFSIMYSGGKSLDTLDSKTKCLKNIFKNLFTNYSDRVDIKIIYDDNYPRVLSKILDSPKDYLILDCKFDDCSYSGSQISKRLLNLSNIVFNLLKNHSKYTEKNPNLDDPNGIFYFDLKQNNTCNKNVLSTVFRKANTILQDFSNNNQIYFLDKIKKTFSYTPYIGYQGLSQLALYKNTYKKIEYDTSLDERLQIANRIYNSHILNKVRFKSGFNKYLYNPDDLDNSLMDLYKQKKGIQYYICMCIPYITNTAIETLDKLLLEHPFYYLEKLNVETPLNISTQLKKYNEEPINDLIISEEDIKNLLYGNTRQHELMCDSFHLSYDTHSGSNICKYLQEITKYSTSVGKRCCIYFDHKMATFNSSIPMTLILGSVWFPINNGIPFFYGPLIKNPALIEYTDKDMKNLLHTFGDTQQTNYYLFDTFIKPPYKLTNPIEKAKYLESMDCLSTSSQTCDCIPKCKSNGDICLNKDIMDVVRDTWKSTIM